jgi:hypothetical protein
MNRGFGLYVAKKIWSDKTLYRGFRNIDGETGIRIAGCKNKEQWQKIGI